MALRAVTFPLTGLRAPNEAAARRPSLAVKIDNVNGAWPQAGLNRADIVFDILVEGGLTRLMAVYQSHGAPLVGPIRSARPVDARLLRLFHGGYFAYSGASSPEIRPVMRFSHAAIVQDTHYPELFFRRNDHASPDNLFSSTARLLRALHRKAPHTSAPPQVFHYSSAKSKGTPTSGVVVPFPAATAGWTWAGRHWVRTQDGHADRLMDGSRVSATNVVILSVKVVGTGIFEANGSEDPLPVTIGSGKTWVLTKGVRVAGTWRRATISDPVRLIDSHGRPISLTPGRTWVELMPRAGSPSFHR
ncbi:MAG: DUF3048 domain-containing protein [Nocardioides sp.]|nr:DUF3048 domain-containing protein [Nocardioides sp.]